MATLSALGEERGWPVSVQQRSSCTLLGLPDGIYGPDSACEDGLRRLHSFDERGIEDWASQVLSLVVPGQRALAINASAATWTMTGLSRFRRQGWAAKRAGVRWRHIPGGQVFAVVPWEARQFRHPIIDWLGYDDEWHPETIIVPHEGQHDWNELNVRRWCRRSWKRPCDLVPQQAERAVAFFCGWLALCFRPCAR